MHSLCILLFYRDKRNVLFHDEQIVIFLSFLNKDILIVEEHVGGCRQIYVGYFLLVD